MDGKITFVDALQVLRHVAGKITIENEQALLAADADGKDGINVIDAGIILQSSVDSTPIN